MAALLGDFTYLLLETLSRCKGPSKFSLWGRNGPVGFFLKLFLPHLLRFFQQQTQPIIYLSNMVVNQIKYPSEVARVVINMTLFTPPHPTKPQPPIIVFFFFCLLSIYRYVEFYYAEKCRGVGGGGGGVNFGCEINNHLKSRVGVGEEID